MAVAVPDFDALPDTTQRVPSENFNQHTPWNPAWRHSIFMPTVFALPERSFEFFAIAGVPKDVSKNTIRKQNDRFCLVILPPSEKSMRD